jgi:catechol 2,3-dioxygenase-like lactoylglutathione lyase family enzyme
MDTPIGFHHVEINVLELKRTKDFYGWLLEELGFYVYQEWDQGVSYKCGTAYLVFTQTEDNHTQFSYHRKRTGLNHLAFWAKSRAQIEQLRVQLTNRNISILYEDRFPYAGGEGHYALFFEDPDRIKIEIVAPR